ncbi:MAG: SDR family oxidoreductase [Acidobacteria bacterium]|jgi:3-oxoacyl-[acyl-carrier protein] reductase|nr:SDR family oxidoreductase [Acidobacteriota bacterium]
MADNFTGKVALITGGSRGIGYAIAEQFGARGVKVAITGTSQGNLDRAKAALAAKGIAAEAIVADVRDRAQVQAMVDRTVAVFGGLDILVNNAGVGRFVHAADMTVEQWHDVIDTNLTGVFYCCSAALPHLRARKGGYILNISSLAGKNNFVGGSAYCASKAALNAFSETLMLEVRQEGIRVSYVMPGSVSTEFGGRTPTAAEAWKLTADDVAQVVVDLVAHNPRSLPSRVEIRPSMPAK